MDRLESMFAMNAALDNSIQSFRLEQVDGKLLPHVKEGLVAKEDLAELERNQKMERTFGRKGYKGTPRYSPFKFNNGRGKGKSRGGGKGKGRNRPSFSLEAKDK